MSAASAIRFGPFRLMGRHGPLLRDDREIKLQRKALAVLWTLASHPNEPVTRSTLMDAVWPGAVVVDDVLSYQVKALRQAIEEDPRQPRYLLTVHRIGFRLVVPEEATPPAERGDIIGRDTELQALLASHAQAGRGQRQFVFVCGEAGIGKTALIEAFLAQLRADARTTSICRGQSLEVTGESEAYQPILDALERGARDIDGDELLDRLRRNAPSWLRQLPRLLTAGEIEELQRITAGTPLERQRRELAEALEAYATERTLVLVIEDLHWSDASSVAFLGLLAQRKESARLLVICSCRPVETIVNQHPARALQLGLNARGHARSLFLEPLPESDARRLIERQMAGVTSELGERILQRSGGHPLFLIHLTDYLRGLDSGPGTAPALEETVPPQLRELIELQLSQLTASEQLILEVGAVAGHEFAAAAVSTGSGIAVESVEEALESMAQRRLFIIEHRVSIWPDGTASGRYRFRHALYGQTLRQRMGPSRAARLHRRLAERLETAFSGRGAEIATDLAYHYEAGGMAAKAAEYCIQTAQSALERLAPHEVREQVARGLNLLAPLAPDLPRHRTELRLRIIASYCLQIERGYVATAGYDHRDRIDALIELVGDDPVRIPAVEVQWLSRHFNMEFDRALGLSENLRDFGRDAGVPSLECAGLGWAAHSLHCMGQHEKADRYAAEGYRLTLAASGQFSVSPLATMSALGAYAITRWFLGFAEQALAAGERACAIAEQHGNPYTHCMLISASRGMLLEFTGDYTRLLTAAADNLEFARRCGHLESQRWSSLQLGIAQYRTGDPEAALRTLLPVLEEMRRLGLVLQVPLGMINAARAWSELGEHARALEAAEQALQIIRQRGHRPWEPEVLRAMGELRRAARPRAIAAATVPVWEALELARARGALALELRAATSLARLQRDQGRLEQALALLEPLLARFTEGGDLRDQVEARELITELRS